MDKRSEKQSQRNNEKRTDKNSNNRTEFANEIDMDMNKRTNKQETNKQETNKRSERNGY